MYILHNVKNAKVRALYRKKRKKKFNRLQIEVFFHPSICPPPISNIGPSNLSFVRIYAQGVLTGFYGITKKLQVLNKTFVITLTRKEQEVTGNKQNLTSNEQKVQLGRTGNFSTTFKWSVCATSIQLTMTFVEITF